MFASGVLSASAAAVDIDDDIEEPMPVQRRGVFDPRGKQQYLGTWSHTERPDLVKPRDMTKADFGALLMRLLAGIWRRQGASGATRQRTNSTSKEGVFEEPHRNGEQHKHFTVLAELPWPSGLLRVALQQERIEVIFSGTHEYYWTTFVYLVVPGMGENGKSSDELDHDPWLSEGHPTKLETIKTIPRGARACDKAKVRRYLAVEEGPPVSQEAALPDKEFAAQLVRKKFGTVLMLQAWVAEARQKINADRHALPEDEHLLLVGLEAYMYKHQRDLKHRVQFAWDTANAPATLAMQQMSAWDVVVSAGTERACVCSGCWAASAREVLLKHVQGYPQDPQDAVQSEKPREASVKLSMRRALQKYGRKHSSVLFHGPKDAGKSFLLKPLLEIFGDRAFIRPVGLCGNYPLQEIFGKKVAVLQDLRTTTFRLPFDHLLAWFEGESFRVPLPQNHHLGDGLYREAAPIFASSSSKLRIDPAEAHYTRVSPQRQNDMMDTRWVYWHSPVSMPNVEEPAPCAHCFSIWLQSEDEGEGEEVAPSPSQSSLHTACDVGEAMQALLDWVETHGPIKLGPVVNGGNVGAVSDALAWPQRYLQRCGRLVPFLHARCSVDAEGIVTLP